MEEEVSPASSSTVFAQTQMIPMVPHLSYLPYSTSFQPGVTLAFPVSLPAAFEAALSNGQPLGVVVAVIDSIAAPEGPPEAPLGVDQGEEESSARYCWVSEGASKPQGTSKSQARRERRRRGYRSSGASPLKAPARGSPVDGFEERWKPVHKICNLLSEEGSREAAEEIERSPGALDAYSSNLKQRLGEYMSNAFSCSVLLLLLKKVPYGRKARRGSVHEQLLVELIEGLPRSCSNPLGREVYLELLARASEEGDLPSQTSKLLLDKLCQHLGVLIDSSHAAIVLKKALSLQSFQGALLTSLQGLLGSVCRSNEGCEFVSFVLRKYSTHQLAMTLLESQGCFKLLWKNAKWNSLLVQASSFGNLHQKELAERFRASTPEEQMKIPLSVKRAALWT
jgi:hypothetical protein